MLSVPHVVLSVFCILLSVVCGVLSVPCVVLSVSCGVIFVLWYQCHVLCYQCHTLCYQCHVVLSVLCFVISVPCVVLSISVSYVVVCDLPSPWNGSEKLCASGRTCKRSLSVSHWLLWWTVSSLDILKKAFEKASSKSNGPKIKLESSISMASCLPCALYRTTLQTLTELRMDILGGELSAALVQLCRLGTEIRRMNHENRDFFKNLFKIFFFPFFPGVVILVVIHPCLEI